MQRISHLRRPFRANKPRPGRFFCDRPRPCSRGVRFARCLCAASVCLWTLRPVSLRARDRGAFDRAPHGANGTPVPNGGVCRGACHGRRRCQTKRQRCFQDAKKKGAITLPFPKLVSPSDWPTFYCRSYVFDRGPSTAKSTIAIELFSRWRSDPPKFVHYQKRPRKGAASLTGRKCSTPGGHVGVESFTMARKG